MKEIILTYDEEMKSKKEGKMIKKWILNCHGRLKDRTVRKQREKELDALWDDIQLLVAQGLKEIMLERLTKPNSNN